ncbi:hypothetical protein CWATWH0402_2044 [Crocosphaera watsonii WH 0402]|uniref:Uncharacterized protein n=2 Tax=Crocosphaera watsonii TaxID=263511 RepID=T2JYY4_CROWT|nr:MULTISPECIES: hypothetical protein [Crocosphaera]CCQ58413.1 hypothetical protein CWATWH0005_4885 [Crocosphaera watsonii WH 0005]CCQ70284.1 hypothetical protein CWATWH0402_2044 [Crocosphaera watsonii WH 0402]
MSQTILRLLYSTSHTRFCTGFSSFRSQESPPQEARSAFVLNLAIAVNNIGDRQIQTTLGKKLID